MKINSYALTDVGRKRGHNEDNYIENLNLNLFAVADGMGGHQAGEVASQLVLDLVSTHLRENFSLVKEYQAEQNQKTKEQVFNLLDESVQSACQRIFDLSLHGASVKGMGTTFSALLVIEDSAFIVHVGDSRVYLCRGGKVYQLTDDHTLLNEHLKKGLLTPEEAKRFPHKNVITRAVGVMEKVPVDTFFLEIAEADRFLLCSDGLHGYFDEHSQLVPFLAAPDIEATPKQLVDFANGKGGKDNITAVVVEVTDIGAAVGLPTVEARIDVMQQVPLFEFLDYRDMVRMLNASAMSQAKPGEVIMAEGEPGDCFYVILSGEFEVSRQGVYITALGKGGHFGEMALIDDHPRSATITAASKGDLLMVKRSDFLDLLNREPKVASRILLNIARTLSERLRETTQAFAASRKKQLKPMV
jgi:PPM family protein phosphatase